MTARISIVLPVYNGERYLAQAIESCLAQTCSDWELILVDDGSTDQSPEIIARFVASEPRIRSFRHEHNRNLPAALNTGFAAARGSYLTWTSDDNLYLPEALEVLSGHLDTHPEIDVVYADARMIDEQGDVVGERPALPIAELLTTNVVGACFLYRDRVQQQLGGYRDELFLAEDYDFWMRAARDFRFAALPRPLYLYRSHGSALSMTRRVEIFLAHERIFREHIGRAGWCGRNEKYQASFRMALMARANGFGWKACRYFFTAFRFSPMRFARRAAKSLFKV